jgi:hypothetical protein
MPRARGSRIDWTNPARRVSFAAMNQPDQKAASPASRALDAGLTLGAFLFFTWILRSHVPSNDPVNVWLWAAVSASCLTAVFWLCLQMFRAVLRMQRGEHKK